MLLSQRQRELGADINNAVQNAGGWVISPPGSRRVRYELLAKYGFVADELSAGFRNHGLQVREIGLGERMTPDGPLPSLVFEVVLPFEKRPSATIISFGEVASTEVKALRKVHGLTY